MRIFFYLGTSNRRSKSAKLRVQPLRCLQEHLLWQRSNRPRNVSGSEPQSGNEKPNIGVGIVTTSIFYKHNPPPPPPPPQNKKKKTILIIQAPLLGSCKPFQVQSADLTSSQALATWRNLYPCHSWHEDTKWRLYTYTQNRCVYMYICIYMYVYGNIYIYIYIHTLKLWM